MPTASEGDTAGAVRERLIGAHFDSAHAVVVLDEDRLVGLLRIERLLAANADSPIAEVMDSDPPALAPGTDRELAARQMIAHEESSLAVVDRDRRFKGVIPAGPMLGVLLDEHDEDLARLGGYLSGSRRARSAAEEPISDRLWHRLPWLLVGLVGAMASAVLVGAFEQELEANVLLAYFIPGLVYMAGAIGTQTVTVLIRAMAAGVSARAILRREMFTGLIIGFIIGAVFVVFALIGWGDEEVALAVGAALFASCSIATLVAVALPAALQWLGKDPAFGSGPLATVIQDLLSIAVYFAIVVLFVA